MPDSRKLEDLDPRVAAMARAHIAACAAEGIRILVTFTLRSYETQAKLYAQGRTAPGKRVTNAPPGYSFHNFGLAYDLVPKELTKLPNWGDTPMHQARANELWAEVGALGKAQGLRWGGEFKSIKDRPHFEWSGTLKLADLRAGETAMSANETPQIQVNGSPLVDQLWAGVRQIAPPVMAFALGRHWISGDLATLLAVAGAVVYPIVLGQLKTRHRAKQLATIAGDERVPDAVAVLKP